jgi:very-short-patch-repair endonuclease
VLRKPHVARCEGKGGSPDRIRGLAADARINRIAAAQHGLLSTAQMEEAGISARIVQHRVQRGQMVRMHRGVYRIGPIVSPRAAEMAALLVCGTHAALSHWTAGALHGLLVPRRDHPIQVTVASGGPRSRPGLRIHRSAHLPEDEVALVDGLRVTTPFRTLVDLAGHVDPRELERMVARGDRDGLMEGDVVRMGLNRHAGRPGIGALRALLAPGVGPAFTRSELESRVLALIREGRLPQPATNVRVAGLEVDFLWRDGGLVAEADGFRFHGDRAAFEEDRRRDAILVAAGYRVVRFTWTEVTRNPLVVAVRIAQALVWGREERRGGPEPHPV